MLDTAGIHHVNVVGADQVLEACRQCPEVRVLVYTSTYNVVFGGQRIINGTEEKLEYLPDNKHPDQYGAGPGR
jgi:nucleoside-diphosphate-sugar epimerase